MDYGYLKKINSPQDIKKLTNEQMKILASEVRKYLIEIVSKNGGHLAPNLGVVEIIIALHKTYDMPKDDIIFDVGHQSYVHKILTGRREELRSIRRFKGISGFPNPKESVFDSFIAGHASTSISAALGIATAKKLKGDTSDTIALIGDGALSGGLAFEGLNNAGRSAQKITVILNDNEMSISQNVGAFSKYLNYIRTQKKYFILKDKIEKILNSIPLIGKPIYKFIHLFKNFIKKIVIKNIFFEDMGFTYLGPVDGHDIEALCTLMQRAKELNTPVLVHAITTKGRGFKPAEEYPCEFHGVGAFDPESIKGKIKKDEPDDFSHHMGKILCSAAKNNKNICAITAAMQTGTGLESFALKYKDRFFDVGIAEGHAVTFAAGLAKGGMQPCFAVYSSFLQRGYDEIIHDVAIQNLPVIFFIDRAGIVGEDGETHQGIFDVAFTSHIPNLTVYSPATYSQLENTIKSVLSKNDGPYCIRYPRGGEPELPDNIYLTDMDYSYIENSKNKNILIITYGKIIQECIKSMDSLKKDNIETDILLLNKIKPFPENAIKIAKEYSKIIFVEEGIINGGAGSLFEHELCKIKYKGDFYILGIENQFVEHGSYKQLIKMLGIDSSGIEAFVKKLV